MTTREYWPRHPSELAAYETLWAHAAADPTGHIKGKEAVEFLKKSGLSPSDLKKIWSLSTMEWEMDKRAFFIALRYIAMAQNSVRDLDPATFESFVEKPLGPPIFEGIQFHNNNLLVSPPQTSMPSPVLSNELSRSSAQAAFVRNESDSALLQPSMGGSAETKMLSRADSMRSMLMPQQRSRSENSYAYSVMLPNNSGPSPVMSSAIGSSPMTPTSARLSKGLSFHISTREQRQAAELERLDAEIAELRRYLAGLKARLTRKNSSEFSQITPQTEQDVALEIDAVTRQLNQKLASLELARGMNNNSPESVASKQMSEISLPSMGPGNATEGLMSSDGAVRRLSYGEEERNQRVGSRKLPGSSPSVPPTVLDDAEATRLRMRLKHCEDALTDLHKELDAARLQQLQLETSLLEENEKLQQLALLGRQRTGGFTIGEEFQTNATIKKLQDESESLRQVEEYLHTEAETVENEILSLQERLGLEPGLIRNRIPLPVIPGRKLYQPIRDAPVIAKKSHGSSVYEEERVKLIQLIRSVRAETRRLAQQYSDIAVLIPDDDLSLGVGVGADGDETGFDEIRRLRAELERSKLELGRVKDEGSQIARRGNQGSQVRSSSGAENNNRLAMLEELEKLRRKKDDSEIVYKELCIEVDQLAVERRRGELTFERLETELLSAKNSGLQLDRSHLDQLNRDLEGLRVKKELREAEKIRAQLEMERITKSYEELREKIRDAEKRRVSIGAETVSNLQRDENSRVAIEQERLILQQRMKQDELRSERRQLESDSFERSRLREESLRVQIEADRADRQQLANELNAAERRQLQLQTDREDAYRAKIQAETDRVQLEKQLKAEIREGHEITQRLRDELEYRKRTEVELSAKFRQLQLAWDEANDARKQLQRMQEESQKESLRLSAERQKIEAERMKWEREREATSRLRAEMESERSSIAASREEVQRLRMIEVERQRDIERKHQEIAEKEKIRLAANQLETERQRAEFEAEKLLIAKQREAVEAQRREVERQHAEVTVRKEAERLRVEREIQETRWREQRKLEEERAEIERRRAELDALEEARRAKDNEEAARIRAELVREKALVENEKILIEQQRTELARQKAEDEARESARIEAERLARLEVERKAQEKERQEQLAREQARIDAENQARVEEEERRKIAILLAEIGGVDSEIRSVKEHTGSMLSSLEELEVENEKLGEEIIALELAVKEAKRNQSARSVVRRINEEKVRVNVKREILEQKKSLLESSVTDLALEWERLEPEFLSLASQHQKVAEEFDSVQTSVTNGAVEIAALRSIFAYLTIDASEGQGSCISEYPLDYVKQREFDHLRSLGEINVAEREALVAKIVAEAPRSPADRTALLRSKSSYSSGSPIGSGNSSSNLSPLDGGSASNGSGGVKPSMLRSSSFRPTVQRPPLETGVSELEQRLARRRSLES